MTITLPGGGQLITVDSMLKNPTRIAKRIIRSNDVFLSDYLYRGPIAASGGAVTFSEAGEEDAYPSKGDVQQIEPGGDYPMVDVAEGEQLAASVSKFGAAYRVTYEARDDNNINPISRGNIKVRNAMLRSDASRALAAIEAKVTPTPASAAWSVAKAWRQDILTATSKAPQGYEFDTIVISKATSLKIQLLDELINWMPREGASNPLLAPGLTGLLNLQWVINDRAGSNAYLIQRETAGFVGESDPYGVKVVDRPENDEFLVKAKRRSVPIVDEPASVQIIAGV